jgi:ferredoxin
MRVRVDPDRCQGHSRCYQLAPEVFDVDDYGLSSARAGGVVPAGSEAAVRLAVANCPEHAIAVVEG